MVVKSTSVVVSNRAGQNRGKHWSAVLRGNDPRDARLVQPVEVSGVLGRENGVGGGTQRNPIEEEAGIAANDQVVRRQWRPGEADARGQVVRIRVDRLQELKVVAEAQVERQARADPPFVLRVHADVGIGLGDDRVAERLGEPAVGAGEKAGERSEGITATCRPRVRDGVVVEHRVHPGAQCMRPCLMGDVVDELVHRVLPSRGASRQCPERRDPGDADGGADRIGRRRLQIAVADLSSRLVHGLLRERPRVAERERLVGIVQTGGSARRVQRPRTSGVGRR